MAAELVHCGQAHIETCSASYHPAGAEQLSHPRQVLSGAAGVTERSDRSCSGTPVLVQGTAF